MMKLELSEAGVFEVVSGEERISLAELLASSRQDSPRMMAQIVDGEDDGPYEALMRDLDAIGDAAMDLRVAVGEALVGATEDLATEVSDAEAGEAGVGASLGEVDEGLGELEAIEGAAAALGEEPTLPGEGSAQIIDRPAGAPPTRSIQ